MLFDKGRNMRPYTVSFFGHRKIYDLQTIEEKLPRIISNILCEHDCVEFLIGRQGEFDEYVASVIKRELKKYEMCNATLVLVLPYMVADIEYYKKYYDDIIVPECLDRIHPKAAAYAKNKHMIDSSDFVVVYVKVKGGAYQALQYAIKEGKKTVNVAIE